MSPINLIIALLAITSIAGIAVSVKLIFIIEDLRLENAKLRIDLRHK